MGNTHFSGINFKTRVISGGVAGNLTVTGIAVGDTLVAVSGLSLTEGAPNTINPQNLTSEFSITAANTINNAGGTNTTGMCLFVFYLDADA